MREINNIAISLDDPFLVRECRRTTSGHRTTVLLLCSIALVARLLVAAWFPNVIHPDETFQYIEQAYRAVTGRGLVPWEYAIGIRSWMLPGLLIPTVAAAQALSLSPAVMQGAITLTVSLFSLAIVVAAYTLGVRAGGRPAGVWAGLLTALWPEIALMSSHALADTLAAIPLASALAIGYRPKNSPSIGNVALASTGLLLCLAGLMRPQLLPAIAIAGLWMAGLTPRRYALLSLGALPALVVFGMIDWLTWGAPFASIIGYVHANSAGVAAAFGVSPVHQYVQDELETWRWGVLFIVTTAVVGMRRLPLVAVVGLVVLATFSAVGHKENRFIYPALPLLFLLCGVGTAEISRWLSRYDSRGHKWPAALLGLLWIATGSVTARSAPVREKLNNAGNILSAIDNLNADVTVCGVAVAPASYWWLTPVARFRPDVPLYAVDTPPLVGPRAYNAIMTMGDRLPDGVLSGGFRYAGCIPGTYDVCIFKRRTPCRAEIGQPLKAYPGARLSRLLNQLNLRPR